MKKKRKKKKDTSPITKPCKNVVWCFSMSAPHHQFVVCCGTKRASIMGKNKTTQLPNPKQPTQKKKKTPVNILTFIGVHHFLTSSLLLKLSSCILKTLEQSLQAQLSRSGGGDDGGGGSGGGNQEGGGRGIA